jgi:hypothetical protein
MAPERRSASVRRSAVLKRGLVSAAAIALICLVATASGGAATPWWFLFATNGDLWETDGDRLVQRTRTGLLAQPQAEEIEECFCMNDVKKERGEQVPEAPRGLSVSRGV